MCLGALPIATASVALPLPHRYRVTAVAGPEGELAVDGSGLEPLRVMPPAEFGGPGGYWSPETMLTGAVSTCFLLTFRAIARARAVPWVSLDCDVEGVLDREQGTSRFTEFVVRARLSVPEGTDVAAADHALYLAEQRCLVSNSLTGRCRLEASVEVEDLRDVAFLP